MLRRCSRYHASNASSSRGSMSWFWLISITLAFLWHVLHAELLQHAGPSNELRLHVCAESLRCGAHELDALRRELILELRGSERPSQLAVQFAHDVRGDASRCEDPEPLHDFEAGQTAFSERRHVRRRFEP